MISDRRETGPKIEGGVDAVVIGATADARAASALLAKAGLHVIEIETGASRMREAREFAPGYFAQDGDPLAATLDSTVIDSLDLYRHGLSFVRRRLETFVRFTDGAALVLPGDPALSGEAVAILSPQDAQSFEAFFEQERRAARSLADWFSGGDAPALFAGPTAEAATSSIDGALVGRFAELRIENYLRAEAALGASSRPSEAYTWFAMMRRLAGDTAGLQGAIGLIEGGARSLQDALRRSGQALGVVTRQTDRVSKVIVEWDRVAGVEFDDGSQIRAPIIISAMSARETFLEFIGRARLDIEFAQVLDAQPSMTASLRAHLAINGPLADHSVASKLDRRFLLAPDAIELDRAYNAALEGSIGATPIAELVFPSCVAPALAPEGCATASILLHPVADRPLADESWSRAVEASARAAFDRVVPGAHTQIVAVEIESAVGALPPTLSAIERRKQLTETSGVEGYFFCGPESAIGRSESLSPGRRAAERAIRYFRDAGSAR